MAANDPLNGLDYFLTKRADPWSGVEGRDNSAIVETYGFEILNRENSFISKTALRATGRLIGHRGTGRQNQPRCCCGNCKHNRFAHV